MKKIVFCFILFSVLTLGWAYSGFCSPVSYSENTDGDLSRYYNDPVMFFDTGVNTVVGQIHSDYTTNPISLDFDSFEFVIGSGMTLNSLTWKFVTAYTDADSDGHQGASTSYQLLEFTYTGYNIIASSGYVNLLSSSPVDLFPTLTTLGSGAYAIAMGGLGSDVGDAWYTDYIFSFNVDSAAVSVPDASIIWLLGSSLMGLGVFSRKAKRG